MLRHAPQVVGPQRTTLGSLPDVKHYVYRGGIALVTGAASGIGEGLAHGLADRGSHLGLVDRDDVGLTRVAGQIRARHPALSVRTYVVDLSDTAAIAPLAEALLHDVERPTMLINNAGVALGGRFDQVSVEDFEWVMRTNFTAPVHLTHALLPALTASPGAHLVNVSSVYGLIGPEGQSAYASSKFALRGFTEVLRHELRKSGVGVTAVHPGGVRTKIAENARIGAHVTGVDVQATRREFGKLLTIDPREAAEKILDGAARRKARVLIGATATLPDILARVTPAHYGPLLRALVRARLR